MKPESTGGRLELRERFEGVNARIKSAALSAGRSPEEITLIAVSKTHTTDVLIQAIESGVLNLGENRVQEAESKIEVIGRDRVHWHLIGHLQANKARRAVQLFDMVQSLDSVSLARRLDRLCGAESRNLLPVLIQVDLANEENKSGVSEAELPALVNAVKACERLQLRGLMNIPPYFEDPELVRPFFKRMREIRDELQRDEVFGAEPGSLSMGMSQDFEVAIEEGATMVRIGTAIFGERGTTAAN